VRDFSLSCQGWLAEGRGGERRRRGRCWEATRAPHGRLGLVGVVLSPPHRFRPAPSSRRMVEACDTLLTSDANGRDASSHNTRSTPVARRWARVGRPPPGQARRRPGPAGGFPDRPGPRRELGGAEPGWRDRTRSPPSLSGRNVRIRCMVLSASPVKGPNPTLKP
jgi:hypothetical protein